MGLLDRAVERMKEEAARAESGRGAPDAGAREDEAVEAPASDDGRPERSLPEVPLPERDPAEQAPGTAPRFRLDGAMLAQRGYLVPGSPMEPGLLEEYRRIKRDLLLSVAAGCAEPEEGVPANVVMITSSLDGEGKTFVASNLAFSIALEVDRTALLVDGDVIRRGASRLLGLGDRPGLVDAIAGEVDDLADLIVRPENVPNLRVLPAGRPRDNLNELLASERAADVIREIAERYADRVVVLDSPPMLLTSEASVLARLVGQVVVVVQADRTPQASVQQTVGMIEARRFSGLVLNRATRHLGTGEHDYYYDYRDD
jgi:receptor protein-tyrosine kinase